MPQVSLRNLLNVLRLMAEAESAISELYKTAGRTWRHERQFWQDLSEQEMKHSEYVRKMIELISKNQDEFRPGRPLSAESVNDFLNRVKTAIEGLKKGTIARSSFISLVLSLEERIVESNYSQLVITVNAGYKELAKEIDSATADHKSKLAGLRQALQ